MGMLDRYKKKGGFSQLINLIETSGKAKQEQFLNLIKQENPVWEEAIRKKLLSVDKILAWNPVYLGEVLSRVQPLTLATALHEMPRERAEKLLSCMSITERRKIFQQMDESKPSPAEISTCMMKLITETRGFIKDGILKMDKIDQELVIPENIEEILANTPMSLSAIESAVASESGGETTNPSELRFELRPDSNSSNGDVEFLKRKVNQLTAENGQLKHEVSVLRGKLDQIKRIA